VTSEVFDKIAHDAGGGVNIGGVFTHLRYGMRNHAAPLPRMPRGSTQCCSRFRVNNCALRRAHTRPSYLQARQKYSGHPPAQNLVRLPRGWYHKLRLVSRPPVHIAVAYILNYKVLPPMLYQAQPFISLWLIDPNSGNCLICRCPVPNHRIHRHHPPVPNHRLSALLSPQNSHRGLSSSQRAQPPKQRAVPPKCRSALQCRQTPNPYSQHAKLGARAIHSEPRYNAAVVTPPRFTCPEHDHPN